jgi:hypothetical protein
LSKFLKIIAILSGIPAMLLFFYVIVSAREWGYTGAGLILVYILALISLSIPIVIHYVSRSLRKDKDDDE